MSAHAPRHPFHRRGNHNTEFNPGPRGHRRRLKAGAGRGCGEGAVARHPAGDGHSVTGVDADVRRGDDGRRAAPRGRAPRPDRGPPRAAHPGPAGGHRRRAGERPREAPAWLYDRWDHAVPHGERDAGPVDARSVGRPPAGVAISGPRGPPAPGSQGGDTGPRRATPAATWRAATPTRRSPTNTTTSTLGSPTTPGSHCASPQTQGPG